jgi:hypothetical protein
LSRIDFTEADRKSASNGKQTSVRSKAHPVEHFWLCESCAKTMTITLSETGEVRLVPLESSAEGELSVATDRQTQKAIA